MVSAADDEGQPHETSRPGAWAAVVFLAFAILYLLRLGSPGLLDYDEALYAEISRGMDSRNDFLVPVYNGRPFFEKPPLLYWTQIAGYRVLHLGSAGARLGNALAALATLGALYAFALRPLGVRRALLCALILGSAFQFVALARVALTDMLLCLCLVVCLGCLHRAFEAVDRSARRSAAWLVGSAAFAGLAMLAKGAVGLLLPALAAALFAFSLHRPRLIVRPSWLLLGGPVALGVGLSWYLLLGTSHPDGFAFARELFLEHHVGRFLEPMQGHTGSVFYYVFVLLGGFLPWSPFLPLASARADLGAGSESGRFLRLFAIFSVVSLLFFSLAATKLPSYVTPVLPGAALLVADLLERARVQPIGRALRVSIVVAIVLLLVAAAGFVALPLVFAWLPRLLGEAAQKVPGLSSALELGAGPHFAAAALCVAVLALVGVLRGRSPRSLAPRLAGAAMGFAFAVLQLLLPRYDAHFVAPLEELSARAGALTPADERIALVGLRRRPSVSFQAQRDTEYVSRRDLPGQRALLHEASPRTLITTEQILAELRALGPVELVERRGGYVLLRGGAVSADERVPD